MNKPHKHAAVIKAWADGAEIQWRMPPRHDAWRDTSNPSWDEESEYRVKPVPHKWQKEMDAYGMGKIVQCRSPSSLPWRSYKLTMDGGLSWKTLPGWEYRIKPEEVVYDRRVEVVTTASGSSYFTTYLANPNVRFTFEDGVLIKAEVLK